MKKLQILAAIAALVSINCSALNTITLGDTVRIPPRYSDGYYKMTAKMHIEGMCDNWSMSVAYPEGLCPKLVAGTTPLEGMTVYYHNKTGAKSAYTANLEVSYQYQNISSYIPVQGYWDYNEDGEWESYGTAKWMPGDYNMFEYNFFVAPSFRSGYVYFDGIITSGSDQRGAVLQGVRFFSRTYVWVGYMPGDMNGDDKLSITDVAMMIDCRLNPAEYDCWQQQAADYNCDGTAAIGDVSRLINHLLNR
jgi:hypothetical protein